LAVPLSKEPPIPLGKQPTVKTIPARPTMPPPPVVRPEKKPSSAIVLPNYVVPVLAVVLIVVAFIALPKILRRETVNPANAPVPSAAAAPKPAADSAPPVVNTPATQPAKPEADLTAAASNSPASSAPPVAQPTPAVSRVTDASRTPRKVSGSDHGEVLDKVMPKPGSAALASIEGTVRVVVRVHVDAAGNVSQASLEKAGPSRYFADLSLKAAKGWVFLSPGVDGHSLDSEWLIRFDFRPSGANAYPEQVSP
jgi:TonB family protein